jgi:hypothetical protein
MPIERAGELELWDVMIRVRNEPAATETLPRIGDLCRQHRGACPVYLEITSPEGWVATVRGRQHASVVPSARFIAEVEGLVGVADVACYRRQDRA